jgi:hypothetical protein
VASLAFCRICSGDVFVAGEEIAWGQHRLGLETPKALKQINLQGFMKGNKL